MIATVDVLHRGKSFVVAFATEDDARRFITFAEAHARECRSVAADAVYRLDPQWCMGQYHHRPLYAHWGLERRSIIRMLLDLIEARVGKPTVLRVPPLLDLRPSKTNGTTFRVSNLPHPRLN